MKAEGITRDEVLHAVADDGRFFVVVSKIRIIKGNPLLDERIIDRALQRERRAGVIESVARRWRAVEGRSDG